MWDLPICLRLDDNPLFAAVLSEDPARRFCRSEDWDLTLPMHAFQKLSISLHEAIPWSESGPWHSCEVPQRSSFTLKTRHFAQGRA